jgi:hypothetical protein
MYWNCLIPINICHKMENSQYKMIQLNIQSYLNLDRICTEIMYIYELKYDELMTYNLKYKIIQNHHNIMDALILFGNETLLYNIIYNGIHINTYYSNTNWWTPSYEFMYEMILTPNSKPKLLYLIYDLYRSYAIRFGYYAKFIDFNLNQDFINFAIKYNRMDFVNLKFNHKEFF